MVKRVFLLMYSEIRGLHQAAYILAFFAIGSQMLGLVRDRLLAHIFGAGTQLDVYYAAFRIPDVLFALFASVLSVYVLLPFVTEARAKGGGSAAAAVLSNMFSLFLWCYTAIAIVLFIAIPFIVTVLFPGLAPQHETLIMLTRILLLQPLLLGFSSLLGVITQLSQRFILYAISPLVYNLGIILGIAVFYPLFGMTGLAYGVVLGACGHVLIQLPLVKNSDLTFGFRWKIDWSFILRVFKVAIPRALTLSLHQIVLLILVSMATVMAAGSVSVFQFAFNLQSVPLAIIGMSYSVAAFPVLADLHAKQQRAAFIDHVLSAFRHIIFWSVPIIALVVVLRAQIVRVLLGSGEFSWNDTRLTAAILALFVISLAAQALMLLLIRAFYAVGNTRTPLIIVLCGSCVSIGSAFLLVTNYANLPGLSHSLMVIFRLNDVFGAEVLLLAFAFILGVFMETILLLFFAKRQFGLPWWTLSPQLSQAATAALVTGISAYGALIFVVDGVNQETFIGIFLQGAVGGVFGCIGALLTYYLLRSNELQEIYGSFRAKIFKTDVIAPQSDAL